MAEWIIPVVICGLARRSTRNRSCWMSWIPGTKRQSRIGLLGQLLREPPGSICSRAKSSFAPASLALNLLARSLLPCIRTRLRKRIESAVSPASRVGPASRCSCFDLCMGEGSLSCLAAPWLLRAHQAQPSRSFHSFSFRFAMPHLHLRLREDRGLPVLGPCLSLPSPRRPPTSITRDPAASVRIRPQSSYCSSSCTACDLPAHRRPARHATTRWCSA
jgi:hypothetical protein